MGGVLLGYTSSYWCVTLKSATKKKEFLNSAWTKGDRLTDPSSIFFFVGMCVCVCVCVCVHACVCAQMCA